MARSDYGQPRAGMSGIPRGVGAPPPPGMDPKRGKLMCIKVRMLDDTVAVFHLGHKAVGQTLLDEVARHLNLLENDYFGLEFIDSMGNHCWLDKEKPILRQIAATNSDAKFYFIVKFYSPNPIDMEEEYTRYLLCMQIRRDLSLGLLHCAESTAALLAAYLVQSDCGDFSEEDYPDNTYLSHSRFIPQQTAEFQQKVMDNHRNLVGMSPGESDLAMLEVARRCDFYGIKFHAAKDIEGTDANLAVMHLGIKVFHQLHCVSTFSWAKIRKLSFKRKKLLIKLHPDSYQYYKETIEFVFETRNECKNFWKKCVEHHAFFRCTAVDGLKKDHKLFSKGSSFRYHGRTQRQLIDYVREHHKRREPFTRPLRSAVSTRPGPYATATYAVVSDRKKNGRTHASMPHLPHQPNAIDSGTLDARARPKRRSPSERCTSDAESRERPRHREKIKDTVTSSREHADMSLSLPNVLSDDIQVVCRELEIENKEPPKSASGDNFLEMTQRTNDYDNVSEDSYKLSDNERSIRSDLGPGAPAPAVFNTTFTTKRVGNVIVKRVVSHTKSTPNTTDDEDVFSQSESLPVRRRPIKEYPFNNPSMVPIEIDGPNVDLSSRSTSSTTSFKKSEPIYTSSGALLLKPKILSTDDNAYANVKISPDSGHYSTIISPLSSAGTSSSATTYGATGPLPGKVITKENMVITPEGVKEKRTKPVVPPKPKKPAVPPHAQPSTSQELPTPNHPVVHMVEDEPVRSVSEEAPRPPMTRPQLISVQSEDNPDIQKCHLFNSDIPYVLTMRNMESTESLPFSTFKDVKDIKKENFESSSLRKTNKSPDQFKRRKSLDLVPRKRLPSPGNFSSQDHTISPTTPEGDVLEYILRRRSMSHERSSMSKKGKRGDPRRQTQPVRFDLPPSPCSPTAGGSSPFISFLHDDVTEDCVSESRSLHDDMDKLEKTQTNTSMTSFNIDGRAESEESDVMPPPPPNLPKPPPPPPPPKPKLASEKVVETKATTSVLSISSVKTPTLELEPVLEKSQEEMEQQQVEPQLLKEPVPSPSEVETPPFIDDSPKSTEEHLPVSKRTNTGLMWTDF